MSARMVMEEPGSEETAKSAARPEGVTEIAWRLVEASGAYLVHTRALPLAVDAYSYRDHDMARDVILVSTRLLPRPVAEAEAILHELGHLHTPGLVGRVGPCTPYQVNCAMSKAELYATRWALERALPLEALASEAWRMRDAYDIAVHFGCTPKLAQAALDLYRLLARKRDGRRILPLLGLLRRVEREGA